MLKTLFCAALVCAASASAAEFKEWEIGAIGGASFSPDLTIRNGATTASAGFKTGLAVGVFGGEDMYRYFSGEASYMFVNSDLKIQNGSIKESFGGSTQLITGDFLAHFRPREARFRPFVSFGGGIEILRGTGAEGARPLDSLAVFTHTREVLPVGEFGVGIKYQIAQHLRLRIQVRDYISSAPNVVIAPAPGSSIGGVRQAVLPSVSLSYAW
jgi:hypothetical protein